VTAAEHLRIDVITIFPEYLDPLRLSLIGRARDAGVLTIAVHDLRRHGVGVHRAVDDAPFGGGAGMVMSPGPWGDALDEVVRLGRDERGEDAVPRVVFPSPSGRRLTQALAADLATAGWLVLACGRYEGIDERVVEDCAARCPVSVVSIGDYVLFGGEAAAIVLVEATARLVPGVLGNARSLAEESHGDGLLEYPTYTRPAVWRERAVPEVLTSGDHARVARWRRDRSLERTARRRPDLIAALPAGALDEADRSVLRAVGDDTPLPGDAG
jgi:tRNA (guanine37-N1)-methyltransferase